MKGITRSARSLPRSRSASINGVLQHFSLKDIAFINPYCLLQPTGRALLENVIKPKQITVCHIPFAEDDKLGLQAYPGLTRVLPA